MDLCLFVLIDININDHLAFFRQIVTLYNINVYILKTFAVKELLNNDLCTVHQVGSYLKTFLQTQLGFKVFPLSFLDTMIIYFRYTGTLFQLNFQPDLVTFNLGCQDFYIREQSVFPKTLYRCCNLTSGVGDSDHVTYR